MADRGPSTGGARLVLVHGLWNRGWSMAVLAARLRTRGHEVAVFSYPTRSDGLDGHADRLHAFLRERRSAELHLVGHSLGGLVVLTLLNRHGGLPPGRVVLMGTPVRGSAAVRKLARLPGQGLMFGKAREALLEGVGRLPAQREIGMIRGTRSLGFGRITGRRDEANDGSVTVGEAHIEGLKDSVDLVVAHSEMLVSAEVARQVEHFLLHGRFRKEPRQPGRPGRP